MRHPYPLAVGFKRVAELTEAQIGLLLAFSMEHESNREKFAVFDSAKTDKAELNVA